MQFSVQASGRSSCFSAESHPFTHLAATFFKIQKDMRFKGNKWALFEGLQSNPAAIKTISKPNCLIPQCFHAERDIKDAMISLPALTFSNICDLFIIIIIMSSIIDELMFDYSFPVPGSTSPHGQDFQPRMIKLIKINQESILLTKKQSLIEAVTKLRLQNQQFFVKSTAFREACSIRTTVCLLSHLHFWRALSKHQAILLMKELVKRQKESSGQVNLYVEQGRVVMVIDHFLLLPELTSVRWAPSYHRLILKNVLHFQQFLRKFVKIGERIKPAQQALDQFHTNLLLTQILNTTQSSQEIEEESTEYMFANESLSRQSQELIDVERNIINNNTLEKNVKQLFLPLPEFIESSVLKEKMMQAYQQSARMFKSLLTIKYPPKKRIQDYVYNMTKMEVIESIGNNRPIGEGGTCLIYAYRMSVTFISSTDHDHYMKNEEKVERLVAVKRPRPEFQNRKEKIIHEKNVVSKLRSSICYFLPKYYEVDKQSELHNFVLMEMVSGEELDFHISVRNESISLWSKIYLVINVIYGVRHLIKYDIFHLDLKPINILVCKSMITKIIDFGEAYHHDVCPKNYTPGYTFPYVAPEVYIRFLKQSFKRQDNLQYSQKQDVFALGIILSQVFFNSRIFYLSNAKFKQVYAKKQLLQRMFLAGERNQAYGEDALLSMISFLIVRCLDPDPKKRPRIEWIGIALKLMLNSYININ